MKKGGTRLCRPLTIEGMTTQKLAYTFEEAAEQCGYSVSILKQQVADGNLLARYASSKGVIRHADLEAGVDQLPTKPNTGESAVEEGLKPATPRQTKVPRLPLPEPESEWLTPEDLGKSWQLAPGTLANWRTTKKGPPFVRIGGMVRYRRDTAEAWLKAQPKE